MLEKKISELLSFGADVFFLQYAVKEGHDIHADRGTLFAVQRFLANLEGLGLTVTLRAAEELKALQISLSAKPSDSKLTAAQVGGLQETMQLLRPTLWAETGGMIAYIASERRFPIERLIDDIGGLFGSDVFKNLPLLAQQDYMEAGKCLAFERPTAAAFHMLRATESILRNYYCAKLHRKRAELVWGSIVLSMRKYPRRFPGPLLNHLDHIRASFRNPTAHPEKIYDMDEAQDLLSICIDVANRMMTDLRSNP